MPTVVQLPTGKEVTVRAAADAFLVSLGNPNTLRNYAIGVGKTSEQLGEGRPLATVADDEIGEVLGTAVGKFGGQHLERPSRGRAVLAGLVPRARPRCPGCVGLGEAAAGAGL